MRLKNNNSDYNNKYIGTRYLSDKDYMNVFAQNVCLTAGNFNIFLSYAWHELFDLFVPNNINI